MQRRCLLVLLLALVLVPRVATAGAEEAEQKGAETEQVAPEAGTPEPQAAPSNTAPLPVKYDRRKVRAMSLVPTTVLYLLGAVITPLGGFPWSEGSMMGLSIAGHVLLGAGLIFGPMPGYLAIGRRDHVWGMTLLRLLTAGIGVMTNTIFVCGLEQRAAAESGNNISCGAGVANPILIVTAHVMYAATGTIAFVDAALVGRAADRANAQWREKNKPKVQVAPIAWSSGNGDGTFGLAVSGTF